MQRLPQLREARGADGLVHLALALAAILGVWNFFAALDRLEARREFIADALFHPPPATAATAALVESRTNTAPGFWAEPQAAVSARAASMEKAGLIGTGPRGVEGGGRSSI